MGKYRFINYRILKKYYKLKEKLYKTALKSSVTVSYTHLDVYKRQEYWRYNRIGS